ncbi:hypothetical protein AALA98_15735 [Lachnospiraceae bacterium 45-W7]
MAMQINGNYDHSRASYAERGEEKLAAERAEKTREIRKGREANSFGKLSGQQDEYISSEKSGKKPTGLYRVEQDEKGRRKIFFDSAKDVRTDEKEEPKEENRSVEGSDGKGTKAGAASQGKPEVCVGNTNAVDREIRKLKEKKQELEQQIQSASGEEKKVQKLQKKLEQVEQELCQKDNDIYRKQHTVFSQTA